MSRWRAVLERWRDWPLRTRRGVLAIALVVLGACAVLWTVPRIARSAFVERAEARGLRAQVGWVRLGMGRLWLQNVVLEDVKLRGTRAELPALEVRLGLGGVEQVRLYGGRVQVEGSLSSLKQRWIATEERAGAEERSSSGDRPDLLVEGLEVEWRDDAGRSLHVWGAALEVARKGPLAARIDLLRVATRRVSAELRGLEVDAIRQGGPMLKRVEVARASASLNLVPAERSGAASGQALPAPGGSVEPQLAQRVREAVSNYLAPQFLGRVVALSLEAVRGPESLRIGPSRLAFVRNGAVLDLEVAAHEVAGGGTPLGLKARVPLEQEAGAELEVNGGPVSLAALGIREGDFGLIGVRDARLAAEARVVLKPEESGGGGVEFRSRGRIENVRLFRPALAREELSGIGLGWRLVGRAELDGSKLRVEEGELSLGEVRAEVRGEVEQSLAQTRLLLDVQVPLASCDALFDALPHGAAPLLAGIELSGTFAMRGHVSYDSAAPKDTKAELEVKNECRVPSVPEAISPLRFRKPWQREVQGVAGPVQITSGPGTPDWTAYEDISPHLETAILVCEDEGFFRHRGFAWSAIESSIQQNLMEGRFFRGGSTVSMQLAKNLYLGREKTLSRKLQEALLTLLLEQELSKHEIMELYLNVIEFGPGIYGVRQAARYYFNEEPRNLSLGQALYLGSILPKPDMHHFRPDGRVTEKWSAYLRKLMQIAHKIRRITDEELAEGLLEQVAFRQPNLIGDVVEAVDEATEEEEPAIPELR